MGEAPQGGVVLVSSETTGQGYVVAQTVPAIGERREAAAPAVQASRREGGKTAASRVKRNIVHIASEATGEEVSLLTPPGPLRRKAAPEKAVVGKAPGNVGAAAAPQLQKQAPVPAAAAANAKKTA
jgi:hypothetical protein